MKDTTKKFCSFCERKFSVNYNFCPECGRELKIIHKIDLKKLFEPYLKGTHFVIEEYKYGGQHFGWYNGDDINKDSQKVIKRFIKNKPDFLTLTANVYNDFGKLKFSIELKGKETQFTGYFYLYVNKITIGLVRCLVKEEDVIKLVNKCQEEMDFFKEQIKENKAIFKRYNDLKKRLSLKENKDE